MTTAAEVPCSNCGATNAAEARFCSSCGTTLVTRVGVDERRTVTALFADLVGSTSLGERTDPEVMRALVGRFFELASAEVRSRGGTVERFSGDAVLGIFGLTTAHEDDPERAVRAALAIRGRLDLLRSDASARHEIALEARFGIEAGEVVVGDPFGGGTMATGDPVNVAARLEQRAAPGQVVIGPAVRLATLNAVEAEPLGELELKGKDEPISAWLVAGASSELGGERGVPGLRAPMTGRDQELALVVEAGRRAKSGSKAVLFTALGVPGVGKSRLAREAASAPVSRTADGRPPRALPPVRRRDHVLAGRRDVAVVGRDRC